MFELSKDLLSFNHLELFMVAETIFNTVVMRNKSSFMQIQYENINKYTHSLYYYNPIDEMWEKQRYEVERVLCVISSYSTANLFNISEVIFNIIIAKGGKVYTVGNCICSVLYTRKGEHRLYYSKAAIEYTR